MADARRDIGSLGLLLEIGYNTNADIHSIGGWPDDRFYTPISLD